MQRHHARLEACRRYSPECDLLTLPLERDISASDLTSATSKEELPCNLGISELTVGSIRPQSWASSGPRIRLISTQKDWQEKENARRVINFI